MKETFARRMCFIFSHRNNNAFIIVYIDIPIIFHLHMSVKNKFPVVGDKSSTNLYNRSTTMNKSF